MGTDSGVMLTRLAGFNEHRDLQRLVQAGLTPMEATVRATSHGATAIRQTDERGTLPPRKRADYIVPSANPLKKFTTRPCTTEVKW